MEKVLVFKDCNANVCVEIKNRRVDKLMLEIPYMEPETLKNAMVTADITELLFDSKNRNISELDEYGLAELSDACVELFDEILTDSTLETIDVDGTIYYFDTIVKDSEFESVLVYLSKPVRVTV